jgi:SAM-dependent methyltransferase
MGLIGGMLGDALLRAISPDGETGYMDGSAYANRSKLETLLGPGVWPAIQKKTVLDFGCGPGDEAIELARHGAAHVVGVDRQQRWLTEARRRAALAGVGDRCTFTDSPAGPVDVIIAIDSFEHFDDPPGILRQMHDVVKPDGRVLIAFGPTWYHPLGGHVFSVFPWAHLVFTEPALLRWRSRWHDDGARRFEEIDGGLNRMTVRRFERLVAQSPFTVVEFEARPIRKLRAVATRLTREFTTAVVRCTLRPTRGDRETGDSSEGRPPRGSVQQNERRA